MSDGKAIVSSEVPVRKISRHLRTFRDILENDNTTMEGITSNMILKKRYGGIMSEKDIAFMQDMSVARDEANNGMTRLEIVNLIKELTGVNEKKKAEKCWDYIVRKGKMKYLKSGGLSLVKSSYRLEIFHFPLSHKRIPAFFSLLMIVHAS